MKISCKSLLKISKFRFFVENHNILIFCWKSQYSDFLLTISKFWCFVENIKVLMFCWKSQNLNFSWKSQNFDFLLKISKLLCFVDNLKFLILCRKSQYKILKNPKLNKKISKISKFWLSQNLFFYLVFGFYLKIWCNLIANPIF